MKYKERIKEFVRNTEGNLNAQWTDDMTPYSELSAMTEDFIHRKSIEGRIASLFIYHQLCIEMMKQLINYCNFHELICLYPTQKTHKSFKSDASYSEILNELKFKIQFKHKGKFIQKMKFVNDMRNKFGHELFSQWWNHEMEKDLEGIDKKHLEIFELFKLCLRDIYLSIEKMKGKPAIVQLMNE